MYYYVCYYIGVVRNTNTQEGIGNEKIHIKQQTIFNSIKRK